MDRNTVSWPCDVVMDLEAALARMGGNEQLLRDMAAYFLEDAPILSQRLEEAIEHRDAPEAARFAHSLKSLAANFDARHAFEIALCVERHGRHGELDAMRDWLPELNEAFEAVSDSLRDEFHL